MKYKTVLFDLDGTLTDPEEGICGSIQYALEKLGRPVEPMECYHKYIGPPLLYSFETYAKATPEEAKELLKYYRERFSTVGLYENEVYPGISELLRDLKSAGTKIAVATGKPTVFSEKILDHFHLRQYIDVVSGIPLDREPPDKCQVILRALSALGVDDRKECVMIGDRSHDAIGAKKAEIDFIGVLYGYGSREELEAEDADTMVESVSSLRGLLLD